IAAEAENASRAHAKGEQRGPGPERPSDAVDRDRAAGADAGEAKRGERGAEVAKARRLLERHPWRQPHQPLRRRGHVFGEAADRITLQPGYRARKKAETALEGGAIAQQRLAGTAIGACAAREPRIDIDALAYSHIGDIAADLRDDAGGIKPDARRQR